MPKKQQVNLEDIDNAPNSLPEAKTAVTWEEHHQLLTRFTLVTNEKIELAEKNGQLRVKLGTTKILDDLIKPYALYAFRFMCAYCGFVAFVLIAHALSWNRFSLPYFPRIRRVRHAIAHAAEMVESPGSLRKELPDRCGIHVDRVSPHKPHDRVRP